MRILIIADEVWNDDIHPNNVLTNWFQDFDAEFCEIYCSPGIPKNKVCKNYFQITDTMMLKSIMNHKNKAGSFVYIDNTEKDEISLVENENKKLYKKLKSITTDFLRLVRELLWLFGRYDIEKLQCFIDKEKPDIVFCPRLSSLKLLRLEKIVNDYTYIPFIAFTGDNEYSLRCIKISPFFWIKKMFIRKQMKKQIPNYSLYYTHSWQQAIDYKKQFNIETKNLMKSGFFDETKLHKNTHKPIQLVYIGRLYCNRWKTLSILASEISNINTKYNKIIFILKIYSRDTLSDRKKAMLADDKNCFFMGGITPDKIESVYKKSDIVLHIESFDLKNKLLTQYSFSTKVVDSLASGCAVWAIGWKKHFGCIYLKTHDCAFVSTNMDEIRTILNKIIEDKNIINVYARKALVHGQNCLSKEIVKAQLFNDFKRIISQYSEL